jgi:hypothetical protein
MDATTFVVYSRINYYRRSNIRFRSFSRTSNDYWNTNNNRNIGNYLMSKIEVNQISSQCGTTLTVGCGAGQTVNIDANTVTLGRCGATVSLAAGATQSGFGRTGTVDWDTTAKTAIFTAVSGNGYFVNTTSAAVTMTLPATPSPGDIVAVKDYAGTFATNNLTIARNGSNLDGSAIDKVVSTNFQNFTIYVDGTQGWISNRF